MKKKKKAEKKDKKKTVGKSKIDFHLLGELKNNKALVYGILFSGAIILIYLSFFSWLFFSWISNPYINYGIIIPLISGYLIYNKREMAKISVNPYGLLIILFAILFFFFSSMYIKALSFMLLIAGVIVYFFDFKFLNKIKFAVFYLLFMIPLPELFIEIIGLRLKDISLSLTFSLLTPFLSLSVLGDYIAVSGEPVLRYGLPCSGLESFLAFFVFSILFTYLYEKKLWRAFVIITLSPLVAVLLNSIRLSILILVAMTNVDMLLATFHLTSGPVLVIIYGIMLIFLYRRSI